MFVDFFVNFYIIFLARVAPEKLATHKPAKFILSILMEIKMYKITSEYKEKIRRKKIKDYLNEKYSLIGKKFGRLLVVAEYVLKKRRYCVCICDCGKKTDVLSFSLKSGHTSSCGCKLEEFRNKNKRVYKNPIYIIYKAMMRRCYNFKDKRYKNYGGRGICVCDEWKEDYTKFMDWAVKNGYKQGLSIDRINVNGNYEPSNCRWITLKEQSRNKTNNKMIEYNNEVKSLVEWCELFDLSYNAVHYRINKGWSIERALKTKTPTGFKGDVK